MLENSKNYLPLKSKADWASLLRHVAELHEGGSHAPLMGIPYRWEETAPQTNFASVFGHWDTVHIALDTLTFAPLHAIRQILNHLALQDPQGMIPGYIGIVNYRLAWSPKTTCPPLWPLAIQEYFERTQDLDLLIKCYPILLQQIAWFEAHRKAPDSGFYYLDCLDRFWESGVENGIRYDYGNHLPDTITCVDATSHVFALYDHAALWSKILQYESDPWQKKADKLRLMIQEEMFDDATGFFHDPWMVNNPAARKLAFEGMWPIVTGAATSAQAQRVINENLLEPSRFYTAHPIPTVAIQDPHFEYHHWRGPTRNSMTYWAARGAMKYHRPDAACALLEKALDFTSYYFQQTGSIWEFYDPTGDDPRKLSRLKGAQPSGPIANYLGHNPLIAMANLWAQVSSLKECR